MRAMKDSGIEWVGKIPENWRIKKLRNIGVFSASGIDKLTLPDESLVCIINYTDVYGNSDWILKKKNYMVVSAPENKIKANCVSIGDMIFTPSSETIEDIGVSAVVVEELENTAFSYHVLRFHFTENVNLQYKKYLCNNAFVLNCFSSKATGTIRKTLSRKEFKEQLVLLPPLSEQQKIADFLDEKCADIDTAISEAKASIEDYKLLKQSIITKAVTKGLNPNAEMKDSGIEWIGKVPVHWGKNKLNRICSTITDYVASGSFADLAANVTYLNTPDYAMLIRTVDVSGKRQTTSPVYINKASYNFLNNSNLFGGEIVLPNIGASVGDVYIVPKLYERMSLAPNAIMLKTRQVDKYYYYFFKSEQGRKMLLDIAEAAAQPKFNKTDLRQLKVTQPPIDEQRKIADYLDGKCSTIDTLVSEKEQIISELEAYKKSLIFEYVTGKKEVA